MISPLCSRFFACSLSFTAPKRPLASEEFRGTALTRLMLIFPPSESVTVLPWMLATCFTSP